MKIIFPLKENHKWCANSGDQQIHTKMEEHEQRGDYNIMQRELHKPLSMYYYFKFEIKVKNKIYK